jgi:hypothetical protein
MYFILIHVRATDVSCAITTNTVLAGILDTIKEIASRVLRRGLPGSAAVHIARAALNEAVRRLLVTTLTPNPNVLGTNIEREIKGAKLIEVVLMKVLEESLKHEVGGIGSQERLLGLDGHLRFLCLRCVDIMIVAKHRWAVNYLNQISIQPQESTIISLPSGFTTTSPTERDLPR